MTIKMNTLEEIWDHAPPRDYHGRDVYGSKKVAIVAHWRKCGFRDMPALRGPVWRVEAANSIRADLVFGDFWSIGQDHHWLTPQQNVNWRVYSGSDDPLILQRRVLDALHGEARSSFFYYYAKRPAYDSQGKQFIAPLLRNERAQWIANNTQYEVYQTEDGNDFRGKSAKEAETMFKIARP